MNEIDPEMLKVVACRKCHQAEYYGAMIWYNGHTYCRFCTYRRWENESITWRRGSKDYVFPKYQDGIDYTKENV